MYLRPHTFSKKTEEKLIPKENSPKNTAIVLQTGCELWICFSALTQPPSSACLLSFKDNCGEKFHMKYFYSKILISKFLFQLQQGNKNYTQIHCFKIWCQRATRQVTDALYEPICLPKRKRRGIKETDRLEKKTKPAFLRIATITWNTYNRKNI